MTSEEESSENPERAYAREVVVAACERHLAPVADALLEMGEDRPSVQQIVDSIRRFS